MALAVFAAPTAAQSTFVIEGRAGTAIPLGPAAEGVGETQAGAAAGVHFALRRGERSYLFAGFSQLRARCDGDPCGGSRVSTQWEAGMRFDLRESGVVPWLRVGAVFPSIERVPLADPDEEPRFGVSDRGWGGEVGAGLRVPVSERIGISPGARFVVSRVGRGAAEALTVKWLVVDLGLVVGF